MNLSNPRFGGQSNACLLMNLLDHQDYLSYISIGPKYWAAYNYVNYYIYNANRMFWKMAEIICNDIVLNINNDDISYTKKL